MFVDTTGFYGAAGECLKPASSLITRQDKASYDAHVWDKCIADLVKNKKEIFFKSHRAEAHRSPVSRSSFRSFHGRSDFTRLDQIIRGHDPAPSRIAREIIEWSQSLTHRQSQYFLSVVKERTARDEKALNMWQGVSSEQKIDRQGLYDPSEVARALEQRVESLRIDQDAKDQIKDEIRSRPRKSGLAGTEAWLDKKEQAQMRLKFDLAQTFKPFKPAKIKVSFSEPTREETRTESPQITLKAA